MHLQILFKLFHCLIGYVQCVIRSLGWRIVVRQICFQRACEYGIRAMLFIARKSKDGVRVGIRDISKAIDSPEPFMAKIYTIPPDASKTFIATYHLGERFRAGFSHSHASGKQHTFPKGCSHRGTAQCYKKKRRFAYGIFRSRNKGGGNNEFGGIYFRNISS